ncbi:MAG TPA: 4-(cytidine 5'-diphospho)-2-C-methyl-D-erythritol kinase [Candidatus Eisenbacteria bacterium]|nr:4-(cytidine 5'-diphospho)-2-C-methyl-D-erythritol kinase [Candidatus Eisenbacteria bacterium]
MAAPLTEGSAAPLRVRCPAKINLGLWILGKRPDGYHEIDTILQTIALEDEITLEPAREGLALTTRGIPIPGDAPNLVTRAWDLLVERARGRLPRGIRATLTKRIPVGAGLGGGSSDAAGFLLGADRLLGLGLGTEELHALAARLGSDAPFFLKGGTARATGRGEQVRQLCPMDPLWIVLVSPPVAISTTWAYGQVKLGLTRHGDRASFLESALAGRNLEAAWSEMRNDFEDVVLPGFPVLAALRHALIGGGAVKALLAGSGSTLFGIQRTREDALRLANGLAGRGAQVRAVRTLERGAVVTPLT